MIRATGFGLPLGDEVCDEGGAEDDPLYLLRRDAQNDLVEGGHQALPGGGRGRSGLLTFFMYFSFVYQNRICSGSADIDSDQHDFIAFGERIARGVYRAFGLQPPDVEPFYRMRTTDR